MLTEKNIQVYPRFSSYPMHNTEFNRLNRTIIWTQLITRSTKSYNEFDFQCIYTALASWVPFPATREGPTFYFENCRVWVGEAPSSKTFPVWTTAPHILKTIIEGSMLQV